MKNLFLLPTEKPSRLIHNVLGYGMITNEFTKSDLELIQAEYQNIYITNDEEIKGGDYFISGGLLWKANINLHLINPNKDKKIILTTDQDLIKDGVQAIDDEFLEWFVKNPSCESVEVEKFHGVNTSIAEVNAVSGDGSLNWEGKSDLRDYKIIIPKEEPKQELERGVEMTQVEKKSAVDWLKPRVELMLMDGYKLYPNELEETFEIAKDLEKEKQGYSKEEVLNFTQTMIMQYKFGNTNIEQLDLLKETLQQFKNK